MASKSRRLPRKGKPGRRAKPGFLPNFCQRKTTPRSIDAEGLTQENHSKPGWTEAKPTQLAEIDLRAIARGVGRPLKPSIQPTAAGSWLARATVAGKPRKKTCRTKEEAEALIQSWSGAAPLSLLPTRFSVEKLRKAEAAEEIAASLGVDLLFMSTWFSVHYKPADGAVSCEDAWQEYETRNGENSTKDRLNNVKAALDSFAKSRGTKTIGTPTREDVEKWLDETLPEDCKPATYNHRLNDLSTVLAWLAKRGRIAKNPCEGVDRRKIKMGTPTTLAPSGVEAALRWAELNAREWVPWLAIMVFAGVRPGLRELGECRRLSDDLSAGKIVELPGGLLVHWKAHGDLPRGNDFKALQARRRNGPPQWFDSGEEFPSFQSAAEVSRLHRIGYCCKIHTNLVRPLRRTKDLAWRAVEQPMVRNESGKLTGDQGENRRRRPA
jgi:hypothetical protein